MRTISWKHSVIALFAVAAFAACSDDTTAPPADGGNDTGASPCGNKKLDTGEACDGTLLGSMKTCSAATMGMKAMGTLGCTSTCKLDTSKCTSGGGGMGGGAGMGTGGTGNAGTGGSMGGGTMKGDAGPDAGDSGKNGGKTDGGGKTDSGGGTPTKDAAPTD